MYQVGSQNYNFDKPEKMEGIALKALLFAMVYYPLYVFAWFANLDSVKSTILFIVALGLTGYRVYRDNITRNQNRILKDLQIQREQADMLERQLELRERELQIKEREYDMGRKRGPK